MTNPKKTHVEVDLDVLKSSGFMCRDDAQPPAWKKPPWYRVEADGLIGYGETWQEAYDNWFNAKRSTGA